MWFVESEVDVVVLEVGLGGRLDATNLVTPLVSVITPLALEHTAVLGNTMQEIAAEKGGIIKEGVPVVSANQPPEALAVLQQLAQKRNAPLIVASEHWQSVRSNISRDGQTFDLAKTDTTYQGLRLSLLGQHQVANATVVVATLDLLREQGVTWNEAALREGLADVLWPARVEVLQENPIVIADGAHTYASATALIDTINEIMPKGWSCSYLILGFSRNKDISSLLDAFLPIADVIILTRASHPRAADPLKLAAHPAFSTRQAPIVIPKVTDAMQFAQAEAGPNDLIVATGSLFVAAEARASMGKA